MTKFDGEKFGDEVVEAVKGFLARELGALTARIDAIEERAAQVVDLVTAEDVQAAVDGIDEKLVSIKADVITALETVPSLVSGEVEKAVALIPRPNDGKSVTVDDVRPLIAAEVKSAVSAIPPAKDGVGVAGALIDSEGRLVLTLSDGTTKDLGRVLGSDVDVVEIEKMIAEKVSAIPPAKDGVGVAGALIDRDGGLVLTLSDGTTKELGRVVGQDVDPVAVEKMISEKVAAIPPAKDGLGFEDMEEEVAEDGRTIIRRYKRGDVVKEFRHSFPAVLDRGLWEKRSYERGDGVTFSGMYWIAQRSTDAKPDTPDSGWRLAVKRGRDARPPVKV